jgi:hypothetical protein
MNASSHQSWIGMALAALWKSKWTGMVLIAGFICLFAEWFFHGPSPGKAAAALAVAAAVMTLRPDMGGLEKVFWMLVLFGSLLIALRAIYEDRLEHELGQAKVRQEERMAFNNIRWNCLARANRGTEQAGD